MEKLKPLCTVGAVYPGTTRKTVWRFLKILKTELLCDPAIPFLGVHLKELKAGSGRYYLHIHVHSSITHKSQEMGATQVSIDGWVDQRGIHEPQNITQPWTGRRSITCHNMDEPWGHYVKSNKPATKRQSLYDSTSLRDMKGQIHRNGRENSYHGLGGGGKENCLMGIQFQICKIKKVLEICFPTVKEMVKRVNFLWFYYNSKNTLKLNFFLI